MQFTAPRIFCLGCDTVILVTYLGSYIDTTCHGVDNYTNKSTQLEASFGVTIAFKNIFKFALNCMWSNEAWE